MSGPLSIKTSTASTAIPLIHDGTMARFRVNALTIEPPEGNRTWQQIKADCRTMDPTPSSEGTPINPGWPVFVTFPLGTKDNLDVAADWVAPAVAKFQDALLGTGDVGNKKGKPARPDLDPADFPSYIGKEFVAKVGIKTDKNNPEFVNNVLKNLTFPGDVSA